MPTNDVPLPLGVQLLGIAVECGGAVVWALIAWRLWRGRSLVPYEERRPVPWGASDLLLIVLFFLLGLWCIPPIANHYSGQPFSQFSAATHYAVSFVELATIFIAVRRVASSCRANSIDLGFGTARLGRDVRLGALAFLASVTPVFGLQALLQKWLPYTHPLIESLETRHDASMMVSAFVAAVVVAPLFEEFIFRVLLQGWFEALESRRRAVRGIAPSAGPAWWPILLSALLFALMHLGQGAAPIPLFFLAIALGYVYQRTHRIWPSLTTHLLVNLLSMAYLLYQVTHIAK